MVFAAVALVATVVLALSQAQLGPPTDVQSSRCWTCHKQGGTVEGTPLKVMSSLHPPDSLALKQGEPAPLRLEVRNEWLATLHNIAGTLDLSKAPSLAFQPPPDPQLGVKRTGTLAFDAATVNQPERSASLVVGVPAGATDVRITLTPDRTTGPDAPDLILRLWGDSVPTTSQRATTVDATTKGGSEVFHVRDPDTLAAMGYGNWTATAAEAGIAVKPDAAALEAQGFSVTMDAWFNLTGDRTQLAASTARLDGRSDGPKSTTLQWNLFVREAPKEGEELVFTVTTVASFTHPAQFNAVDDWAFVQTLRVPIEPPPPTTSGGPAPVTTIHLNNTKPPPVATAEAAFALSEKSVGEAVGYFTTFVMVVSLITGGLLGGASRRWLNRVLTSAQRRIAFHNLTSYAILLAAAAHTGLFLHEAAFPWSVGLLWGGLAILAMVVLGITGAWQLPLIRSWHYTPWRVVHYTAAVAATVFTVLHVALDGINFVGFQKSIDWHDPLVKLLGGS